MTIRNIDLFDLFGNGTLVMKTNVEDATDDLRYAWYIKLNGKLIYKGQYQKNAFAPFQLEKLGTYTVKAFVRNGNGEKAEAEAVFRATAKTSPVLAANQEEENAQVKPKAERISGMFWQFSVDSAVPEGATYAWYIYQEGESAPLIKTSYSPDHTYVHQFAEAGNYRVKVFVMSEGTKRSASTAVFEVED